MISSRLCLTIRGESHLPQTAFLFLLILFFAPLILTAQEYQYSVRHRHILKDCRGVLKMTPDGIFFAATNSRDSRKWTFDDIRTLEIQSDSKISVWSYEDQKRWLGKDKVFEFEILNKKVTPELSAFLLERVKRPMKIAVIPEITETPEYELPVKHLHPITGTRGILKIYSDKIVYLTPKIGDSRYWRLQDIERFSQPDRFRFQIVSYLPKTGGPTESYDFQLMQDLPEGLYEYLWVRLHPSSYY